MYVKMRMFIPVLQSLERYFAWICLQIFTSFPLMYDMPRTREQSNGRESYFFLPIWAIYFAKYINIFLKPCNCYMCITIYEKCACKSMKIIRKYEKLSANISNFQHSGISARLVCTESKQTLLAYCSVR